ncbi:hypothetical protein K458DRAFT_182783 [Lentithecium fluviatile CBS 122367]|uniref:Uncharacterized protein n=1 Tax=Lentithecium fluviatile CBS 122367 TaxID=1168545 RepID=A0A6G1IEB2_9PLEO|nr:hypothetical protein K458DRAFT_182783 [Lentithecium fluviatile CBS 122367]
MPVKRGPGSASSALCFCRLGCWGRCCGNGTPRTGEVVAGWRERGLASSRFRERVALRPAPKTWFLMRAPSRLGPPHWIHKDGAALSSAIALRGLPQDGKGAFFGRNYRNTSSKAGTLWKVRQVLDDIQFRRNTNLSYWDPP